MLNSLEDLIPCCYRNEAKTVQIVRITEPISAYFERMVMPGQTLYFKAPQESLLEIYAASMASSLHIDTIPCQQLRSISVNNHNLLKKDIATKSQSLRAA